MQNKNIIFYIIILIVVVVGVFASLQIMKNGYTNTSKKTEVVNAPALPVLSPKEITDNKTEIMTIASLNRPLTESEKDIIRGYMLGNKVQVYQFSQEEIAKIMNAMNRKK